MRKILKHFAVLLFFTFSLSAYGQASVLLLGDSLSLPYDMQPHESWTYILETKLKVCRPPHKLSNASKTGQTTIEAYKRLPSLLQEYKPGLVIIALGGNDAIHRVEIDTIKRNLSQMVYKSKQAGAQVLLIEMEAPPLYGFRYARQFKKVFKKVAKEHKINRIPFFLQEIDINVGSTVGDSLHPGPEVQTHIYHHIWPYIQEEIAC